MTDALLWRTGLDLAFLWRTSTGRPGKPSGFSRRNARGGILNFVKSAMNARVDSLDEKGKSNVKVAER